MKLLLADDHLLFKETLTLYIQSKHPLWIIETAETVQETIDILDKHTNVFDLLLLDLRMPGMDSLNGINKIKARFPDLKIAILSGIAEDHHVKSAIEKGVDAYFPKTLSGKALVKAIDLVVNTGHRFIPMDETGLKLMPAYNDDYTPITSNERIEVETDNDIHLDLLNKLTKREKEVIHYLTQGLSNKAIAREMDIQPTTAKVYIGQICKKLEVSNRTQAALFIQKYGLNSYI